MKKVYYLLLLCTLTACDEEVLSPAVNDAVNDDAVLLAGIEAVIGDDEEATRAISLSDSIGRYKFEDGDRMVFTKIQRTLQPITTFTYSNINYLLTQGAWDRQIEAGEAERIYWSDAKSAHTFIGYSLPKSEGFDWKPYTQAGTAIYYGSIGDATSTGTGNDLIDYNTSTGAATLEAEDILLTYDAQKKAETGGAVARISFHHGLSNLRVIVNLSGFAATENDKKTKVSDLIVKAQPTLYKWSQTDYKTIELAETDQTALNTLYSSGSTPVWNQEKAMKLWIPRPEGYGTGASKTFTFYGLTVPHTHQNLEIEFTVQYPKPLNTAETETKIYKAILTNKSVLFSAGYCTTINISLNHRDEKITVGAEYSDWEFKNTPDHGELQKNSTCMSTVSRDSVTIVGDEHATVDDATWLYQDGDKILDIYGNDGSKNNPYTISTAYQLLSFAHEVKGTNRTATGTVAGGMTFEGKYVKLDANICMQASPLATESSTTWIGIGDASHPFEGYFVGGVRIITLLNGSAFFHTLGQNAHVDQLIIESTLGEVTSNGGLAEVNRGTICSCQFQGKISSSASGNDKYVGGLVGDNQGKIIACCHIGNIIADCNKGGIAGKSSGTIAACFSVGGQYDKASDIQTDNTTTPTTPTTSYRNCGITASGTSSYSFYSNTELTNVTTNDPDGAKGISSGAMQRSTFVGALPTDTSRGSETKPESITKLNDAIYWWVKENTSLSDSDKEHYLQRHYIYQPATYPSVY